MAKALAEYREAGYPHMLMPDHVPQQPDDPDRFRAISFCYGSLNAL